MRNLKFVRLSAVLLGLVVLRTKAQNCLLYTSAQRGTGQAVDAAKEYHNDPVGALFPAEAGGIHIGPVSYTHLKSDAVRKAYLGG